MVISFSVDGPRRQLINEGEVYTYRWTRRSFFEKGKGDVEHTWFNKCRGGKSLGEVEIREIDQIDVSYEAKLSPYVEKSGFPNEANWNVILIDFKGGRHKRNHGYLYHVKLKEDSP